MGCRSNPAKRRSNLRIRVDGFNKRFDERHVVALRVGGVTTCAFQRLRSGNLPRPTIPVARARHSSSSTACRTSSSDMLALTSLESLCERALRSCHLVARSESRHQAESTWECRVRVLGAAPPKAPRPRERGRRQGYLAAALGSSPNGLLARRSRCVEKARKRVDAAGHLVSAPISVGDRSFGVGIIANASDRKRSRLCGISRTAGLPPRCVLAEAEVCLASGRIARLPSETSRSCSGRTFRTAVRQMLQIVHRPLNACERTTRVDGRCDR